MTFVWSFLINHCSHPIKGGHQISQTLFALSKANLDVSDPLTVCAITLLPWGSAPWYSKTEVRLNGLYFLSFSIGVMFPFSQSPGTSPDCHYYTKIMHQACLCYCRMFGTGTVQSANWNISDGVWASWETSQYFNCFSCTAFFIYRSWES